MTSLLRKPLEVYLLFLQAPGKLMNESYKLINFETKDQEMDPFFN